jgi:putative nucleotidyltransferase with HDIG domain
MNSCLVTTIVSLTTDVDFAQTWKTTIVDYLWHNLTIIPLGAVLGALWLYRPWSVLALALPMVAVRQSFQFIADLRRETLEALAHMADLVDQRDTSTFKHSQRVADVAEAIAQELGLAHEDAEMIRISGRLHDVGKIGMNDALLYKPGKFDESEIRRFRQHSELGAKVATSFHVYPEVQNLILHHHERFDGKGYPDCLQGEAIPLGSRILAVADSFHAMTSKRPYRSTLSLSEAVEEVLQNRGTQFDPLVVDAFMRIVQRWGGAVPWPEDENTVPTAQAPVIEAAVSQPPVSFPLPQTDTAPSRAHT